MGLQPVQGGLVIVGGVLPKTVMFSHGDTQTTSRQAVPHFFEPQGRWKLELPGDEVHHQHGNALKTVWKAPLEWEGFEQNRQEQFGFGGFLLEQHQVLRR